MKRKAVICSFCYLKKCAAYKMDVEIHVSPRMLCPCGKTARQMTREERQAYDDAQRRLAERAGTTEEQRAEHDVAATVCHQAQAVTTH